MRCVPGYRATLTLLAVGWLHYGCGTEDISPPVVEGLHMDVPAAAGSTSPNLAAGANGDLILSWLEPDAGGHRLRYAALEGEHWSEARTVARGDDWFVNWADFPSVLPLSDGYLAAHWLRQQPAGGYAYDIEFSLSADNGNSWSEPLMPHNDGTPTEHGFVTLYPDSGGVGIVWLDGRDMDKPRAPDGTVHGLSLRGARIERDLRITREARIDRLTCDCCQTDVAVTPAGPVAVYRDRTADETRDIYVARYTGDAWETGRPVADDGWTIGGCPVNGPVIAANSGELAVAWFTSANDRPKVRMARSRDNGQTFSAPIDISDGRTLGRAGIAMLDGGAVAVSWLCKASDDSARICLRHVAPDDSLGPVRVLSGSHRVPALSVPQLSRSGAFLIAAWTIREDETNRIVGSRIPVDALR